MASARLQAVQHQNGPAALDAETYDPAGNPNVHATAIGQALMTPDTGSVLYDSDNGQLAFRPGDQHLLAHVLTSTSTASGVQRAPSFDSSEAPA